MKKILFTVAFLTALFINAQAILIVDNNSNIDTSPAHVFNTFSLAVAAAANGDIIYVQPSETAYGNVSINKELTVYGMGHTPEMNAGRNATFGSITISSSNVKLAGVESTTNLSITGTTSNVTIENNFLNNISLSSAVTNNITIQGNVIDGYILLHSTYNNSANVTITHNFFETTQLNAFSYFNSTTIFNNNLVVFSGTSTQYPFYYPNDLVAQNNIFVSTASFNGTNWQGGGTPVLFNNCLTYSYNGVTLGALNGTGNFDNTNPQFTNIPGTNPVFNVTNDYTIGSGSLGTDGNDIGLFNGYYDFDMRGYPTLLPYLEAMTISNNMIPAGADLQVNLKANANKTN